jgi:hypothetical protein
MFKEMSEKWSQKNDAAAAPVQSEAGQFHFSDSIFLTLFSFHIIYPLNVNKRDWRRK